MEISRRKFLLGSLAAAGMVSLVGGKMLVEGMGKNSPYLFLSLPEYRNNELQTDGLLTLADEKGILSTVAPGLAAHSFIQKQSNSNHVILISKGTDTGCIFDIKNMKVHQKYSAKQNYVLWGHGCYLDNYFLISEKFEHAGLVTVRNKENLQIEKELNCYGIAHECRKDLLSDALVVAGIHFTPKMQIADFYSSIRWIDLQSGSLLDYSPVEDKDMTIAHFDQNKDGAIVAASFYKDTIKSGPGFIYFGRRGENLKRGKAPLDIENKMQGQAVGIKADFEKNLLLSTHPLSDLVCFWDIEKRNLIKALEVSEPMGCTISSDKKHFVVTTREEVLFIEMKNLKIAFRFTHNGVNTSSHMLKLI